MGKKNFCYGRSGNRLYTIAQLIRMSFRDNTHEQRVNFKLIHIVLLVLAKKLNILHRMVNVASSALSLRTDDVDNISIDEVNVCAQKSSKTDARAGKRKSQEDFEKERIYIVYVPPEEVELLPKETDARRRKVYPLTLTTQDSYLNLFEKINDIRKLLGITDSDVKNRLPRDKRTINSRTILSISARLEKTEQSIDDMLGALVVIRKGPTKKGEDKPDPLLTEDPSAVWGFIGEKTIVKVYAATAETDGPWTAKETGNPVGELEPEENMLEEFDLEELELEELELEELEIEEIELQEVELVKGGEVLDASHASKEKDVPRLTKVSPPITKNSLECNISKLKKDIRREFATEMRKLHEVNEATRRTILDIGKVVANIDSTEINVDNIQQVISRGQETQAGLNKTIALVVVDNEMTLSKIECDVATAIEKLHDDIFKLRSDVNAINDLKESLDTFSPTTWMLGKDQKKLYIEHYKFYKKFESIVQIVLELSESKFNREEYAKVLEGKAGQFEINGIVGTNDFYAQINKMHDLLNKTMKRVQQKEIKWQEATEKVWKKLDKSIGKYHLEFATTQMYSKIRILREKLDNMIDVVKPFERANDRTSIAIDIEKCISCGSRPKRDFLKCFERGSGDNKTITGCVEEGSGDKKTICVPLTPILNGKRSTCEAYSKKPCEQGDFKAALTSLVKKKEINDSEKQVKKIPCKPCNKPKKALRSKVLKSDESGPDPDVNPSCRDFMATQ